jgi:hypothetical protein
MEKLSKISGKELKQSATWDSSIVQRKINSIWSFFGVVFTLGFAAFYFSIFN